MLSAVTAEEVAVAGEVAFDTAPGSLLTGSTPVTVNSIDAAETVEVVGDITPEFADISGLGEVQSTAATDIFTVETAPVLTSVELITETGEALISAEIATETETVLTGLESSPVNVVSPTAAEPVDGDIIAARRGIIAVENTDGDISVYTSCAVRGAQLDTTPAPGM